MDQLAWIAWLILGVALIVAEVFTLGFFLLWFGIGAILAGLVGLAGGGLFLQFLVFAITSVALTAMSRTIFARYFQHDDKNAMKSGVDALPGKVGIVVEASRGAMNQGAVKVFGSTWTAYPIDGENELSEGEKVEVVEVRGSSIFVRRLVNELPEWRQNQIEP
jgi:membrane protein implicated in regulation of membrane protease activity